MPVETLQETIDRHSKHGGYIPFGGDYLFGDGAIMSSIPGFPPNIQEPPREEVRRLGLIHAYWTRRTALAIEVFKQFKKQLLGESMNGPKWRPEVWGKEPDVAGEEALLFLRDLVRKEREHLAKAKAAYEAHPTIVAQRKAEADHERAEQERAEQERDRQARILAITLD